MLSAQNRPQRLASLEATQFDVAVIGGGITGAAVARDAAARGLSVALLERQDWAAGTSWRSTKLVHGGLRYLAAGQVRLVFESLAERALLMEAAPHLVQPADFLFPGYRARGRPAWQVEVGLTVYDLLALGRASSRHRRLSRREVLRRERLLESPDLVSGSVYPDARTDDARLTLENVLDAAALGAVCATGMEIESLLRGAKGRVEGLTARDRWSGRATLVRSRVVVNAAGPWGDRIRRLEDGGAPQLLRLSRGVHVTVPSARLPITDIVAFPLADGRLLFAVPHGPVTMLGTTDTDFAGAPDEVFAEKGDVEYLLTAARETFPAAALSEADVLATFAGLRPLVREPGKSLEQTSREEAIVVSEGGLVTVTGGKLTTHRRMGERTIDRVAALLKRQDVLVRRSATRGRRLPGAAKRLSDVQMALGSANPALPDETVHHLLRRYGCRASGVVRLTLEDPSLGRALVEGLPDIEAEILFAARAEDAHSLSDTFIRRTHLFWQAPGHGMEGAERACALLARELGWSKGRQRDSLDAYAAEIEGSRRALTRGVP